MSPKPQPIDHFAFSDILQEDSQHIQFVMEIQHTPITLPTHPEAFSLLLTVVGRETIVHQVSEEAIERPMVRFTPYKLHIEPTSLIREERRHATNLFLWQ
jgi:hypothetical protein